MTFEGIRPVLPLPFGEPPGERINQAELGSLVEFMVGSGAAGLVVLGLASEAWTLTEGERDETVAEVAASLDGRLPLVVGIDGSTQVATDRARRAVALGADGLMVLPASSARTKEQFATHFARVAEAGGVPILVQDSPQVTRVPLSAETLTAIVQTHPLIAGVKSEAPGAGDVVSVLVGQGIEVIAGWGGLAYLESLSRGASGCMPGCDLGPAFVALDGLARSGDPDGFAAAESIYEALAPLLAYESQSLELFVLGAKRIARTLGIFSTDRMRSPGRALDQFESATIDRYVTRLQTANVPGFST